MENDAGGHWGKYAVDAESGQWAVGTAHQIIPILTLILSLMFKLRLPAVRREFEDEDEDEGEEEPADEPAAAFDARSRPATLHGPHLHTANTIQIRAPREKIFAIVSDLARWPLILPHYRSIEFLGKDRERAIVRMTCVLRGLPISWVASYQADWRSLEMRFEHLRGWTKGMQVKWALVPAREGCRAEIVHGLQFRVPLLARIVEPVIGRLFVDSIAGRTLRSFQNYIEYPPAPRPEEVLTFDEPEVVK